MTRMALTRGLLISLLMAFSVTAAADVLLIQEVRQASTMNLPANGLSMNEVESRFGSPQQKLAAIGNPPITRWVYDHWSVYFEYDRVLYTVLNKGEVIESRSGSGFESGTDSEQNSQPDSG